MQMDKIVIVANFAKEREGSPNLTCIQVIDCYTPSHKGINEPDVIHFALLPKISCVIMYPFSLPRMAGAIQICIGC